MLGDIPRDDIILFDTWVIFFRQHMSEMINTQYPCYVGDDKVKSLGWYLLLLSKDTDDAFEALYKYITSSEENILKEKYELNRDVLFYAQRDMSLQEAMHNVTLLYPTTKLFVQKSAKPLQIFKQMVWKLYLLRKEELISQRRVTV
jgi:hypothetical protein